MFTNVNKTFELVVSKKRKECQFKKKNALSCQILVLLYQVGMADQCYLLGYDTV
jgi:hypothetical protein